MDYDKCPMCPDTFVRAPTNGSKEPSPLVDFECNKCGFKINLSTQYIAQYAVEAAHTS